MVWWWLDVAVFKKYSFGSDSTAVVMQSIAGADYGRRGVHSTVDPWNFGYCGEHGRTGHRCLFG